MTDADAKFSDAINTNDSFCLCLKKNTWMKTEKRLDVRQRPKKNNGKKEELQGRTRRGRDQNMNEACHTLGTQWHSGNSGAFFVTLVRWASGLKRRTGWGLFLGAVVPPMLKYLLFILDDAAKIGVCFQQRTVQRRREGCRRTALMSEDWTCAGWYRGNHF